jgi:hypothetical protein
MLAPSRRKDNRPCDESLCVLHVCGNGIVLGSLAAIRLAQSRQLLRGARQMWMPALRQKDLQIRLSGGCTCTEKTDRHRRNGDAGLGSWGHAAWRLSVHRFLRNSHALVEFKHTRNTVEYQSGRRSFVVLGGRIVVQWLRVKEGRT